jgi:hypothetical protein
MSIFKRGRIYWYKFMWNGKMIRESTKQRNDKIARNMESAHRTALANGSVGIRDKKSSPTLKEFCDDRIEPWAKANVEHTCRNNWLWFRAGIPRLTAYEPLAKAKVDGITNEQVAGFAAHEQTRRQNRGRPADEEKCGMAVSSINSALRVLRRVLNPAAEWGILEASPRLRLLPGEHRRERVVTQVEEQRYLEAAQPLLADVATVLADTGLRPDECYRLRWEHLIWANGVNGSLLVTHGKNSSGTPCPADDAESTIRAGDALECRWKASRGLSMVRADD